MSAKTMASYIAKARNKKTISGTPQTVITRSDEVRNNAGGASFQITPWQQLERFLILGAEGGTYYASEKKLTIENAKNVETCIKEDGVSTVDVIVEVSKSGRAPKNDPALLALAICAGRGDTETRGYALAMLPEVARIGTHLFHFAEYVNAVRGWGRLLREGIANWYNRLDTSRLGLQVVKYQQRDGWSHRDLLRLAHPNPGDDNIRKNLYRYIVKGPEAIEKGAMMPQIVIAYEQAKTASTEDLAKLIIDNDLPRECVPTEKLNDVIVWDALLQNMPMTAMIRNLGKMTSIGLLRSGTERATKVVNALTDMEALKKQRVHPFTILLALNQYGQGRGLKGSLSWTPVKEIKRALDDAFYASFRFIEPSRKRNLFALDVSGSMHGDGIAGSSITPAMGAAAMAMVSMRTEEEGSWKIMGFGSPHFQELPFRANQKLEQVIKITENMNFGRTDCSLPMVWALQNKLKFDSFNVYTDNETYAGNIKPYEAIRRYRDEMGINAKLVVVGMTASKFSIADPTDRGMLDVVGFDSNTPQIIADFTADRF